MKRYLVRTISYATNDNTNFAGETSIGYYGKDQKLIRYEGTHCDRCFNPPFDFTKSMLEDYGYKRVCDARKSWIYKNPENTKYWKSYVDIVEVNI